MLELLHRFYPETTITITSRDPDFVTPDIKAKLRRKNKLMRSGRIEEAAAIAKQVGIEIARQNAHTLKHVDAKTKLM